MPASSLSSRPPIVGLPSCIKYLGEHPYHAVGGKYIEALVSAAGCMPVLLPSLGDRLDLAAVLECCDGILLTGSVSNVAPDLYGQTLAHPDLAESLDDARDATTFPLIDAALAAGLPLFGICRGFQELNVACGGTLYQQVHAQPGHRDHRGREELGAEVQYGPAHTVKVVEGSDLQKLLGGKSTLTVNSVHGQGIDQLGRGLVAEAHAEDGLIEAIRLVGQPGFAMAVQWHPEWKVLQNPDSLALFRAFGEACSLQAARRASLHGIATQTVKS